MGIRFTKVAAKAINTMDRKTRQRIKDAIDAIPTGDIKPLRGYRGLYRLRVGGWRIIFSCPKKETVLIERVSPRGGAYKGGF